MSVRTCPIGLIPAAVKLFGNDPEPDDEVARQVLRLDFAPLLLPEPPQGGFVLAHNDTASEPPMKYLPSGLVTDLRDA
jgi:hypothetical protein